MRDGSRRIFMTTWRVVQGRKRKFSRFLYLRNNFFRGCLLVFVVMHWEMSKTTKTPQSLSRHTATISTIDSSNFPWIFFSNFDHSFIPCKHNKILIPLFSLPQHLLFLPAFTTLTIMNSTQSEKTELWVNECNALKNYWFALIKIHSSM